ncbi:transcription factor 20 [Heterodontus francisci]|uniref:transcription factor 20 n=1 Tax=Heterodontus francisci TaxID=7792 RepID=UPI00355B6F84
MQSFGDPGPFQSSQQNFQQIRADSSRLETYRQQNPVAQSYEAHGITSKEYYNQQPYQGYGNNTAGSYFSAVKQVSAQHPQSRPLNAVSTYQSGAYSRQYQSEGQAPKWGSPGSSVGGLSQYGQDSFKGSVPSTASVAAYQQQHMQANTTRNPPALSAQQTHFMHQPHHKSMVQQASPYIARSAQFNQSFQSSPTSYPTVQDYSHPSRSYEGYAQVPASSQYDRQSAATPDYPAQSGYGYKTAIAKSGGYEQNKATQVKQHSLQYHNQAKLHLLNQSPQVYYQPDAPVKSPEQFYQTFSPTSSHSPVSTVVRSPSYCSTPSPLMANPETLQYGQQSEGGSMASDIKSNVPHMVPSAVTCTTQSSSKTQGGTCKPSFKDKIPEKLLSDGAFSSLIALSSQVENIPRTVQQLLLSNTLAPHRKMGKRLPKKSEILKELKSSEENLYSEEPLGTPQSEPLGTPQSVQTDLQEGEYSSSSEDQLEKIHFFHGHCRNSANLDALRKNLDTILSCSVTSANDMVAESRSDHSTQSGESYPTSADFDKLASDRQPILFSKEDTKGSSVIIRKDSSKERLETELKFNHFGGDKESKRVNLNLYSAENFIGHLVRPKRSGQGQAFDSDCNQGTVKSDCPMMTKGFGDAAYSESQLFPHRMDSTNTPQSLAVDYRDSLMAASNSNHECYSSQILDAPQDLEKLKLVDLPDKKGKEPSLEWEELEANLSQCDLQKKYLQKFQANYKQEQRPLQKDSAPGQLVQEMEELRGVDEEGNSENGGNRINSNSELGLPTVEWKEPSNIKLAENEVLTVESKGNAVLQDAIAAITERKSVICDVSPTQHCVKELVPPHPEGNCGCTEEKLNSTETGGDNVSSSAAPRLLGHSVIHVGPAIVAEPKVGQGDPSGAEMNPGGESVKCEDNQKEEALEPTLAIDTLSLPTLSSDLISSALTEIENSRSKMSASKGPRVRRLSARAAQGASLRGKDHSPLKPEEYVEPLKMMPAKLKCLGPQRDRAKGKGPQQGFAVSESMANLPTRMCTRSSTALLETELTVQSRGLLRKGMVTHREDGPREMSCSSRHRLHSDSDKCLIQRQGSNPNLRAHLTRTNSMPHSRPTYTVHPDQQMKGHECLTQESNSYKSVVLRARTRAQGMILQKDVKQRKSCNLVSSRCLTTRNNSSVSRPQRQLTARHDALNYVEEEMTVERSKAQNSALRMGGQEDQRFPLSHPLKRKGYCSLSLIPAKRQHQMLKANDTRTEKQQTLPGPSPSEGNPAAQSVVDERIQGESCEGTSEHSLSRETSNTDGNTQSVISLKTPPKTKILPPRKGRGLKLEAIVQKITSPNSKSFACSNYSDSNVTCLTLDEILSLKEEKLAENTSSEVHQALIEQNKVMAKDASSKIALVELNKKCLIAPKRVKEENESRSQEKSSIHVKTDVNLTVEPECTEAEGRLSMKLSLKEKTTEEKEGTLITNTDDNPQLASPSSVLSSVSDPGPNEGLDNPQDVMELKWQTPPKCCLAPAKRRSHSTGNKKVKQTKNTSKIKRPTGRGGRRRRKHLKGSKTTKAAHRRKNQLKRRNLPLVETKEPVIRLKYVSYKMPRAENKAKTFSPYIHVEKSNEVSSICTIVNTLPEEQSRFQKMKKRSSFSQPPISVSKTLPTSSAMLPGPVVLDSAKQGYLVCCLCGRPKNHKELGDLFGPYYPEEYIPPVTKNQHVKGKLEIKNGIKEKQDRLSIESKVADSDNESTLSITPEVPSSLEKFPSSLENVPFNPEKATEVEDQNPLRTSSREKCKKLSCYCCEKTVEDTEPRKVKKKPGLEEELQPPELPLDPHEHWLHGACAVWTSGVYLAAGKLYGLQEAVEMASEMRCSICEQAGATLGCYTKGCNQKYHYICAIESGCQLSEENFSMKCLKHKSVLPKTL